MSHAFNIRVKRTEGQYSVECFDTQDHGPDHPYATTQATDLHTAVSMMVPYVVAAVEPMIFDRLLRR